MTTIWIAFWAACLIVAGASFALITLAIAFHGIGELKELVRQLGQETHPPDERLASRTDRRPPLPP
jgi:hypothetical protein